MLSRRWAKYIALLLLVGMLVPAAFSLVNRSGPSGPSSAELERQQERADRARCAGYARTVAEQVQTYVSGFDADKVGQGSPAPGIPSIPTLRSQVTELTARVGAEGCDAAVFRRQLAARLGRVTASGPLGTAVASTLVANVRDVLEPGTPRRVTVPAGADLATELASVPNGSTLTLAPGRFQLADPLVILQDLTLRGAGRGRTTVVSSAAEAAVLQAARVRFTASDLSLTHVGPKPASLLVLRAGRTRLTRVSLSEARARGDQTASRTAVPDLAGGGNGVIAMGTDALTLTDSRVHDNEAGGVVASGSARVRVTASRVSSNALCGVCFVGRASGLLGTATLEKNGIGVIVGSAAHPVVRDTTFSRNRRAGLVTQERARPQVRDNRMDDNGDIGIAVYGRSAPRLLANTVTGHRQVGIVVDTDPTARPLVRDNAFARNGQAGLVFLGRSRGRAVRNRCASDSAGLVLGGTSRPDVSGGGCPVRDERTS